MIIFFGSKNGNSIDKVYGTMMQKFEGLGASPKIFTEDDFTSSPEILSQVEFIFSTWGMPTLTEEDIKKYFPKLRAVFYGAGSVQHFARPFLNCGVKVFSAACANAAPVAEFTVAQIILANKGYFQSAVMSKRSYRKAWDYSHAFPGNFGVSVGLIGMGMIGRLVAGMLKPYDLRVLAYDAFASQEALEPYEVQLADLKTIFSECQVISNHLANNEATQGMLNYPLFSLMKDNATFINTGRGAQVVEDDLIRALKDKPDRTALLDVTFPEPPEEGSPLYTMENVFLSPHIAGAVNVEVERLAQCVYDAYIKFSKGLTAENDILLSQCEVKPEMLKTMA